MHLITGLRNPTLVLTHVKFLTSSVSRPVSAPKLCCMIIATTAQDIMKVKYVNRWQKLN